VKTRAAIAAATVAMALFAAPASAPAATSCDFIPTSWRLNVEMSAAGDSAVLSVAPGGEIVVSGGGGAVACFGVGGPPSVTNTDVIQVFSQPGASSNTVAIVGASRFAPGASAASENGGDAEIEVRVMLRDDPDSLLELLAADNGGESVRFGTEGINPNALDTEVQPDADIVLDGVASVAASGGAGPDALGAQGGAGTGSALVDGIQLFGLSGADRLTGGGGADDLAGGLGNDELSGAGGDDTIDPGPGDDTVDGGPGTDVVDYSGEGAGVLVDLAIAGPQATRGSGSDLLARIENVLGTYYADVLRGDGGPNRLIGNPGADALEGRGGTDELEGGADADTLDVRDGGPDRADCGTEIDVVTADLPGIDTLSACELVLFPTVKPISVGDTATGSSMTGADTLAPSFHGKVKADPARFVVARKGDHPAPVTSTARGTTFRYSLSEAATVTFAIERRTSGRNVKGTCRATTRSNAPRPKCSRFMRVGTFHARARAGANATRFSGRIAGRPLTPGSDRAVLSAVDAAGNRSNRATASFTVLRPKPRGASD
jgi:Ca2+-binding RTX toxin-like protein